MKSRKILIFMILFGVCSFPLFAQSITLKIPDTTVVAGDLLELPVYADQDLTGLSVLSWQLQIGFSAVYLEPLGIVKDGTLSSGWTSIQLKYWVPGQVSIAAAGGTPLSGSGKLIMVRFRCLKAGSVSMTFTDPAKNLLNEGDPPVTLDNGTVRINARPVITVRPETGLLTTGEGLQYSVQGGTPPFAWSITLDSVASISSSGLLTAGKRGFTRIIAEDSQGIIDTSGLLEVRGLKLSIPDTSGWQANPVSIPVYATDVSGLGIVSGLVSVSYPTQIMDAVVDVETAGCILEGIGDVQVNTGTPGVVSVSFAGTTALSGSGPLFRVRYMVSRKTGSAYLDIGEAVFNEDILATQDRGYFSIKPLPDLTISPQKTSLLSGESVTFSAGGGYPPYAWSLSNPSLASIDASGKMTALKGGILFVSVSDDIGASGQTDTIFIYDTRVSVPDTTAELYTTFDLPVAIGDLPAGIMDVSAIEAVFTFGSPELELLGIETAGSLTEGWYHAHQVEKDSILRVALAGSGGLSNSGTLFFLRFRLTDEFTVLENAGVWIRRILLNEGSPAAISGGGSITGFASGEDLALSCSTNLSDACELPVPIEFSLTIQNNGGIIYEAGDTVHAGLILPGEPPVSIYGILETPLPPAGLLELLYRDTVDQSYTGTFGYILYADMEEDVNRNNDTIMESFTIFGYPEVDLGEPQTVVASFPYILDAGGGLDSYEWQDGSTGQTFNATKFGLHWVHVILNGCPGSDTINLIATGIDPPRSPAGDMLVFPNPSNGSFRVSAESIFGPVEIGIYNVLGECIYHQKINAKGRMEHAVRLENPVRGPYLLKVNDRVRKIMVN